MSNYLVTALVFVSLSANGSTVADRPAIDLSDRTDLGSISNDLMNVRLRQSMAKQPPSAIDMQHGLIPVFKFDPGTRFDQVLKDELHDAFHNGAGAIIVKQVFRQETMDAYNNWCTDYLERPGQETNRTHPKQADKFVINDLMEKLSEEQPDLLLDLITNGIYYGVTDSLLGFSTFGAFTTHWIKPGGRRQDSHVDYPSHVGSGKFWQGSPTRMARMFTKYQIDHVLPYFSVQAFIASDATDESNGSTEVVPFSQHISQLDLKLHDRNFEQAFAGEFVNVELNQGDVLFFNRGLYHAGGYNKSLRKRNSLIVQNVWLFGVGQHQFDTDRIFQNLAGHIDGRSQLDFDMEELRLRLVKPYPINTRDHN